MRYILVDIKAECSRDVVERLENEAGDYGVEVVCRGERYRQIMPAGDVLVITDREETVRWAGEEGVACIGFEEVGSGKRIYGTDVVVQGIEGVDFEFLLGVYKRYHGIPWRIAETERLIIRESIVGDFEEMYALYQEQNVTKFMPGMTRGKEEERFGFEQYIQNSYPFFGYGLWSVIEKKSGRLVGRAGIEDKYWGDRCVVEVGYMIGKEFGNRGYAKEAVQAICRYAVQELGIQKLWARIREGNEKSVRVIQAAGFQEFSVEMPGQTAYNLNMEKKRC